MNFQLTKFAGIPILEYYLLRLRTGKDAAAARNILPSQVVMVIFKHKNKDI